MSIAVTHVAAEHHPDGTAWTISLHEHTSAGEPVAVTVNDVPERIRAALIEWALDEQACEECTAEEPPVDPGPCPYSDEWYAQRVSHFIVR